MKKYKINPYIPIVKRNNEYLFGVNGFLSLDKKEFINLSKEQEILLEKLSVGDEFEEKDVKKILGESLFKYFIEKEILVDKEIDYSSIYSRSRAYYYFNKLGNVQEILNKKNVLILGCGGIGSHVAWNLVTMGIENITLVDFDVVEESNLNRQLLYDMNDIGKLKVNVLKEKLNNINPRVNIKTIVCKIWSEYELDSIICKEKYDLIIKSLDSPAKFPLWLDNICTKRKIKYITGITVSSSPMIGPTYIPGETAKYTDFFEENDEFLHVSGISLSLGVIMYHISSEVSMEAFKILSNRGKLKYLNCIHAIDEMGGRILKLTPKKVFTGFKEEDKISKNYLSIIFILIITILSMITKARFLIVVNILFAMFSPFFIYKTHSKITKSVFINMLVALISNIIIILNNRLIIDISLYNTTTILSSLFVGISVYIIIALSIVNIVYNLVIKYRIRAFKE